MKSKIEEASKDAISKMKEEEVKLMDKRRKEHPEEFPVFMTTEDLENKTITAEILKVEAKIGEYQGKQIPNRYLTTTDKQTTVINLSGKAIVPKVDRFFTPDTKFPIRIRITIWSDISQKTQRTFRNIKIEEIGEDFQ